jgi:hypothetical protein
MAVAIPNYAYRYLARGKPVFAPSTIGRRIGGEVKAAVETAYKFESHYFHFRAGGHVAAMHHHRNHHHFARIDISRFFYSVSRRRVQSALDRAGVSNAAFYAKWSTVLNPYDEPRYALPYGFVQSPILASLVIATSEIGEHLRAIGAQVAVSVYMDDFALSSDDLPLLIEAFETTTAIIKAGGFAISADKLRQPATSVDVFNCDLTHGEAIVSDERLDKFAASAPTPDAEEAFLRYCASVEEGNAGSDEHPAKLL